MYHPVVEKIKNVLTENSIWFETFEHEPVITSEDVGKVRTGYRLDQGTKALIVRVTTPEKEKKFVMILVQGDKKFDESKVKAELGFTKIRFATEEEVSGITGGVQRGGVPPFGNLFGLSVYMDKGILDNEKIIFNAGDRSYSIGMRSADFVKMVSPQVVRVS